MSTGAFLAVNGETISAHPIEAGEIRATLPANAGVQLRKDGMPGRHFYIAMENPGVQNNEALHVVLRKPQAGSALLSLQL